MKVLISAAQAKILLHRLEVSDAIAACLTDAGSPLEAQAPDDVEYVGNILAAQCESIMSRRGGKGTLSLGVFDNSDIANAVLREAVEGSTWPDWIRDMVVEGEMTKQQANGQRAVMRCLERRLTSAGMKDVKFPL